MVFPILALMKLEQDIFGKALIDYHKGAYTEDILVHCDILDDDYIPLPYLFRSFDEMPKLEQLALEKTYGRVLDVGCCAGSHSLYLQDKGLNVQAIDISEGAITVSRKRGVIKATSSSLLDHHGSYDTILLLMNGTGIFECVDRIPIYLDHLRSLLRTKGQVLLDGSDLRYLYEDDDGGFWYDTTKGYYGELSFSLSYKKKLGTTFKWLYLDYELLNRYATQAGLSCELLMEDVHYGYLARLTVAM